MRAKEEVGRRGEGNECEEDEKGGWRMGIGQRRVAMTTIISRQIGRQVSDSAVE